MTVIFAIFKMIIMLLFIPICMGFVFAKKDEHIFLVWVQGMLFEWAVIEVFGVLNMCAGFYNLSYLIYSAGAVIGVLCILGIFLCTKKIATFKYGLAAFPLSKNEIIYLGLFVAVVLFQIYKALFYAYEDGDDAYYIAIAEEASKSLRMYRVDAYLGHEILVNYRYALALFPMWIASVSRVGGVSVAMLSHTILPPILILVTYIIYVEISRLLFEENKEKRYMFLCLISVFVMFENVSTSTQGTFLLTRARQGKEALADIVLPMLFLYLFRIVKNEGKILFSDWIQLCIACTAAAFTSMFANLLAPLMLLALCIWMLIKKKKFKDLVIVAAAAIPNAAFLLLYMIMK